MELPPAGHEPVLLGEVLAHLSPKPGQTFIDCTIGRAGHARAIVENLGPSGLLIGLDADPRNLEFAQSRLKDLP
ncbi:MAG: 16S rRNA (cytosine(1402)-N(4))-methyltransferase, partial [Pyrinomonadaceae bacterium]|nr:16S rRNA (cytosine(1402)-N(4))-methyltransferase [Phycisphaerales bacterium]